jgi:hypothetical protein
MLRFWAVFLAFSMSVFSCKTEKTPASHTKKGDPKTACYPLELDGVKMNEDGVSYKIISAKAEGTGCMYVTLEYTGCGEESIHCYWSGAVMKSLPPRANTAIVITPGSPCKKLIRKTVCFQMKELVNKYPSSGIIILLKNYEGQLKLDPIQ